MRTKFAFRLRLVVFPVCLAVGACGTATIQRFGAPALEARIVDGDSDSVYVENRRGELFEVSREDIARVDHPGNVLAIVGGVLLGVAAVVVAMPIYSADARKRLGLYYGVPGAAMLSTGLWSWFRSRGALNRREVARQSRDPIRGLVISPRPPTSPVQLVAPTPVVSPRHEPPPAEQLSPEPESSPAGEPPAEQLSPEPETSPAEPPPAEQLSPEPETWPAEPPPAEQLSPEPETSRAREPLPRVAALPGEPNRSAAQRPGSEGPQRKRFTLEVGLGLGAALEIPDMGNSQTKIALVGPSLSLGRFVTSDLAIMFRFTGTTYFEKVDGTATAFISALYGVVAQYWLNDNLSVGGGAGFAWFNDQPLGDGTRRDAALGFALALRASYRFYSSSLIGFGAGIEIIPAFYDDFKTIGTGLFLEFQLY